MGLNDGLVYGSHFTDGSVDNYAGTVGATINGSPVNTSDKNGNSDSALDFPSGSDFISLDNNIINVDSFCVSCWINTSHISDTSFFIGGRTNYAFLQLGLKGSKISFIIENETNRIIEVNFNTNSELPTLQNDTWYFICLNAVSEDQFDLWINSTKYSFYYPEDKFDYLNKDSDSIEHLLIGRQYPTSTANAYNGTIDEPRIYNRPLSDSEVGELYTGYDDEEGGDEPSSQSNTSLIIF